MILIMSVDRCRLFVAMGPIMDIPLILKALKKTLSDRSELLFVYIHGSALSSDTPGDIDVAGFLSPEKYDDFRRNGDLTIGFSIPLEMELEKQLGRKVDFQVLNNAPLSFRYNVVKSGLLIMDKEANLRCDFEYLSRVEYFDFQPRREEYLREIMS